MDKLEGYYEQKDELLQSTLLALRTIILEQHPEITEDLKWNSPCFLFKKKILCFLMVKKGAKDPYILFMKGKELHFPELDMQDRKLMKSLSVDVNADIDVELVEKILQAAIQLY